MKRVDVEVIAPILGSFDHCSHCQVFIDGAGIGGAIHQDDLESYPAEIRAEFQALSDFLLALERRHQDRLIIRLVDPGSPRGMWKAIRHGIRRYPTFIIAGEERFTGLAEGAVEAAIRGHLAHHAEATT